MLGQKGDSNDEEKISTCKNCGSIYSNEEEHYQTCSKIEIECESCGFAILRRDYDEHRRNKCHIRWDIKCPFGCNTTDYRESQLLQHREEKYQYHLDMLCSTIEYFGLDRALNAGDGGKDTKLIGFCEDFKRDVTNDILEFQNINQEINDLKKKNRLKHFEKKEQMRLLEKSINATMHTSYNGKLVWMLQEENQNGNILKSPIFYTGKYGYKLQLLLKRTDETQVLVLVFLEWVYDPILPESFETTWTVIAKIKEETTELKVTKETNFDRTKEMIIETYNDKTFEWIRFEINCSEFSISSID